MGKLNGACALLGQKLDWYIWLLACQHHIYEIVLQSVFTKQNYLLNPIQTYQFSNKFQRTRIILLKIIFFVTWVIENDVHEKLKDIICNILVSAKNKIKKDLPRNHYKEFLKLIISFLRGTSLYVIKFSLPGAHHLARWMEKEIYCLKMYMFRYQSEMNHSEEIETQRYFLFYCHILCIEMVYLYKLYWGPLKRHIIFEKISIPIKKVVVPIKQKYKNYRRISQEIL